jgi:ABC-type phosphate/phosphonate transport system, ATPase component
LVKHYPGAREPALKGIDLTVAPGEFVAVLGRSGAGKSTLIRCINRLVEPTAGTITWNGQPITGLHPRELLRVRCGIGMIFQHFNLIPRLDVLTNVIVGRMCTLALWRSLLGVFPPKLIEEAMAALERVGIAHLAHRRVEELSGGQQQRVAIARVLMQKPKMILGDEPVASLDPVTARSILDFLKELNETGFRASTCTSGRPKRTPRASWASPAA